jgi:hypothetical protein
MGRVLFQPDNACLLVLDMTAITLEILTGHITAMFVNFVITASSKP